MSYNDVLWIHPRPDYKSARILGIPPNATCVQNLGCSKRWCKVSYRDVIGWVNGKYLGEGECTQSYSTKKKPIYYNEKILNNPAKQTIQIPQVTWGACMLICEDNKFCKNIDHNSQTSMCTLFINTNHLDYQRLYKRCSHIPLNNWRASYRNDRWSIDCSH